MKFILVGMLLLLALVLPGQHPYSYHLNEEDYLPSNEVYDIAQDDFGYLWIGCDAGLFRYDGFNYRRFQYPGRNNISISNLHVLPGQELWCQNFSGQIFHKLPGADSLTLAYDASSQSGTYPALELDVQGRAWIATDTQVVVVDQSHKVIASIGISEMGPGMAKWHALKGIDASHIAVISYSGKLFSIDINSFKVEQLPLPIGTPSRFNFFRLPNRLVLVQEESGMPGKRYRFFAVNREGAAYLGEQMAEDPEYSILNIEQVGNRTFLATTRGAIEVDEHFQPREGGLLLFADQKISSLFEDREGSLWLSSLQDGIFIVPNAEVLVYNQANSALSDNSISAIWGEDDQRLVLGTYAGRLFDLDLQSHQLKALHPDDPVAYRAVRKIVKHGDQYFVARGPFTILHANGKAEKVPELSNTRDFLLQGDTIFYAGSDRCGYVVKNQDQWQNKVIRDKGGKALAQTADGKHLYILFTDGLYAYTAGTLRELSYNGKPVNGNTLLNLDGQIWIGTLDEGVLSWDGNEFEQRFFAGQGLADNEVKKLIVYQGQLVAATRKGLSIVDLKTGDSRHVNEFDGLAFKEATGIYLTGEQLFLSTIKGLIRLPLSIPTHNQVAPSIKIDGLSANGKALQVRDSLDMDYSDIDLEIRLSSSALRSRGHYRYSYRMQHLSDDWHDIPASQNTVSFASLPPGNYRFQVAAVNEDGTRSLTRELAIRVHSPFWEKIWFYVLLSVAFALLATLFFFYRLRIIRRKSDAKNQLIASQLTALKAQMNPHFMFNTLNSLQDLILRQDFKSTNYYLSKFATLMRMILSNSEKEEIGIEDEVRMLDLYLQLEKLRFGDEFEYSITGTPDPETMQTLLPPMIIQPYVENAIKHGLLHKKGKKLLSIEFEGREKQVVCTITDNGIGRARSQEINSRQSSRHESFSSTATSKRIELLQKMRQGDYSLAIEDLIEEGRPTGTRVVISFPI